MVRMSFFGVAWQLVGSSEPPSLISAVADDSFRTILVTFSKPVEEGSVTNTSNYRLDLAGAESPTVQGVTFTNDNQAVLETTPFPLPSGNLLLTVQGIRDRAEPPNVMGINQRVLVGFTGVISHYTAFWHYDDSGGPPEVGWTDPAFDQSTWPWGPGLHGYPSDELLPDGFFIQTVVYSYNGNDPILTYYFRKQLVLSGDILPEITLTNLIDDGAVFYVNNREAIRFGMPEGEIDESTLATRAGEVTGRDPDVFTLSPTNFVSGTNVIAVEVHQTTFVGGDVIFGSEWYARVPSTKAPAPMLNLRHLPGEVELSWDDEGFILEQTDQLENTNTSWLLVPDQTNPYLVPTTNPSRFYRLRQ
jgi:hypothetical protein